jgi:dihydrofolate reductase
MTPEVPSVSLIVAVADNGVIGNGLGLPWRLPGDLARFRNLTTGHAIVMGRRTWQSLGRALPRRQNIVVTRDRAFRAEGATVVHSLAQAIAAATLPPPVFVIGGRELIAEALAIASTFELTEVHVDAHGDVAMPAWRRDAWREVARTEVPASGDAPAHSFVTLSR